MCAYQPSNAEDLNDVLDPVQNDVDQNIDAAIEGLDAVLEGFDASAVDHNDEETDDTVKRTVPGKEVLEHLSDGIVKKTEATVFIAPIPASIQSKYDLKAECEEFGEVIHVHICASRRFAFVHFADAASANAAADTGKLFIGGEDVDVNRVHGIDKKMAKKAKQSRSRELALSFKENPWDSLAALLDFFEDTLTPDAVDFVTSMPQEKTDQLIDAVLACIEREHWTRFNTIRDSLNSLDHAQVEHCLQVFNSHPGCPEQEGKGRQRKKSKKKKERTRQREVALGFTKNPSDAIASLLNLFENQLTAEAVDFVSSMSPEEASKLMAEAATYAQNGNWPRIDLMLASLNSLDYTQATDLANLGPPGMNPSKMRAILRDIQGLGGEAPISTVGSRYGVKKHQLQEIGFVCTPVGTDGQHVVSAPAELMALLDDEMVQSGPAPDSIATSKRCAPHATQMDANRGSNKQKMAPGPPLHRHGDMPFFGGPPIDPMGLPFPHAGFPPGHGPAAWLPPPPGPSSVPAAPGRAPPPGSGGAEMFGEVKSCNAKTKYGFLTSPDFHSDIYFRASDVLGNIELLPGQPVSFSLRFREDGHAVAKNIALMSSFDFGFGAAEPYDPDNVAPQEKRKRQKAKKGKSKRARVETQEELDGTGYNGLSPSSGAYVAQANDPQARPRPSSSYDRLADVQDKDYFGVISTEFERVRGYGYLICDETGEEIPFSESNSAFQEGEEVAFRIEYGPERELLAVGLRLLDS